MSEHNIVVEGGNSVRLKTAGKYCDRDIIITAEKGGTVLPELSNPARAEQIVSGYEAIDKEGAVIVGINPYEMAETDETVAEQSDLIEQIAAVLRGKGAGGIDERFHQLVSGTLTEVNDDSITKAKDNAFAYITTLKTAILRNLTSMGGSCFRGCTNLETVDLPSLTGTIGAYGFQDCSNLKNVNIPLATSLGLYSFRNCEEIEKLDLGNISTINGYAFGSCSKLVTLIIRRTGSTVTKLSATSALSGTPIANGTGYIYVYADMVDTFRNGTNWSNYVEQFRAIEDYPEICGEVMSE